MPTYEFRCRYDHVTEFTCRVADRPDEVDCEFCNAPAARIVSLIARTPAKWGGSDAGYFDRGAGKYFNNSHERDAWAKAGGWVNESDLPRHAIEDSDEKQAARLKSLRDTREKLKDATSLPPSQQAGAVREILDKQDKSALPSIPDTVVKKAYAEAVAECGGT